MILRRLVANLKDQNWTAIVIEFVLLVGGVFLGIEVSNWNQEREQRNKAAAFTTRLHADILYELWGEQSLIEYYTDARIHAGLALDALSGRRPMTDEQFLVSTYRATQIQTNTRARATYDELVSTGTIGLIADSGLRNAAISFFSTDVYETTATKAQESEYRRLFRESVPYELQDALLARCGDRRGKALDYASLAHQLDYPCELGMPAESIAKAAAELKAQPRLLPALQLRHADLATAIANLAADRSNKVRSL
ncbi:MAG: hypothetical protein A3E01_19690 [Gammaproteobacteria bacterium RIFCSPHIGHO2_12_FULL_63_22]|nr:MAG: hypothetical protein A3E01_19690 [Gammaproteobacteria bacterium RIFCSPHIGHO2_12_FULL_63_22]